MIGRTLAHYEIVERLGSGGMGEVYLARDSKLERYVGLKVLPPRLANDHDRLERLRREARALAALDHPGIVTVFSVEEADGVHFLTMARVDGRTLRELIPPEGLPLETLIEWGAALADALRAAHDGGVVHRDLKPSNVMVDRDGRLRVLDFGLARLAASSPAARNLPTRALDEPLTERGVVLGTLPYMSPEQAEGSVVDHRSDLFSLGAVLYEMATGRRPFAGESAAALVAAIVRDEPTSVVELRADLPPGFGVVVGRCLAKSRRDRYQRASDVRDDLLRLVSGGAEGDRPPASFGRRGLLRFAAVGAVLLAVAYFVGTEANRPPDAARPMGNASGLAASESEVVSPLTIAVIPLRDLSAAADQRYFADGMTEALITDLSKIAALRVIGRASTSQFTQDASSLAEMREALGVDVVVEGSVSLEGSTAGVGVQLIDADSGQVVWGEQYRRELESILELQTEIARIVAERVEVVVTPAERSRLASPGSVVPAAYDAYLKGRFHRDRFTPQDLETALAYFESALELDPRYAPAHAGIASVWSYRTVLGVATPREAWPLAARAASRALEIDDRLAEGHLRIANYQRSFVWDWSAAEAAFSRAVELNPNYAEARVFYAHLLGSLGRYEEARAQMDLALELDPLNVLFQGADGVLRMMREDGYDEAIRQFGDILATSPGFGFVHQPFWRVLHAAGRLPEALEEAKAHFETVGEASVVLALERGWDEGGYSRAALLAAETLAEAGETAQSRPVNVMNLFSDAGEIDRALEWLDRVVETKDIAVSYLAVLLVSDELRSHPEYQRLLESLDLPTAADGSRPDRATPAS